MADSDASVPTTMKIISFGVLPISEILVRCRRFMVKLFESFGRLIGLVKLHLGNDDLGGTNERDNHDQGQATDTKAIHGVVFALVISVMWSMTDCGTENLSPTALIFAS